MLCMIAKLDAGTTERLTALRRAAERFGIPGKALYGHVTLAAYVGDDVPAFLSSCRQLLRSFPAFSVTYDRIEVLSATSILVASPRNEGALARLHSAVAARWGRELDAWTGGSEWKPHTTLLYQPERDLAEIAAALREGFTPFTAAVERIEFSEVLERGYRIVDTVELQRQPHNTDLEVRT